MRVLVSRWKGRLRLRRTLRWLEPHLLGGTWLLHDRVALLPAGESGTPDAYQQRLLAALGTGRTSIGRQTLHGGPKASCDTLISRGDWTLLMDRQRRWILRITDQPERVERLIRNAQWLSRSYPCPAIEPVTSDAAGAHAVRESFVQGGAIRDAPASQWDPAYRQLLVACQRHVAHCRGRFALAPALDELQRWRLPGWLDRGLGRHREGLAAVLDECPMLEAHGDCHNGNVFVLPDGRIQLIDLERVQSLPFFYDALSLLRGTAPVNAALRRAYLDGGYDAPLAALWEAAGRQWEPGHRVAALLAMAMAHAFRPQFAGDVTEKRREKFLGACEKLREACALE
ncbi:MAG: aminoglycoside phosphotransferase family protein [Ectothiorhodospiraceae bacterium]|nr:aminoglycoside phosphotransferase family protein [Ectothiorhodospiraceae bacterium]